MDKISDIIERAIAVAEIVVKREPSRLNDALSYLIRLEKELAEHEPSHQALSRLRDFLSKHKL